MSTGSEIEFDLMVGIQCLLDIELKRFRSVVLDAFGDGRNSGA